MDTHSDFFPYLPSYFIESLLHLESNWEFEMQLVYVLTLCPGTHMYLSARQSHQSYIQHLWMLWGCVSRHYIFAVNAYFIYLAVNRSDCSTSYIQLNLWINCIVFPFSSEDLKLDNEIFSEITFVKFVQNLLYLFSSGLQNDSQNQNSSFGNCNHSNHW